MKSRMRIALMAGLVAVVLVAIAVVASSSRNTTSAAGKIDPSHSSLTDPTGDMKDDGTGDPLYGAPRGDLLGATAAYRSGGITLSVKAAQLADPKTDAGWHTDYSYLSWEIDTNSDGKPDLVLVGADYTTTTVYILTGKGTGVFSSANPILSVPTANNASFTAVQSMVIGDYQTQWTQLTRSFQALGISICRQAGPLWPSSPTISARCSTPAGPTLVRT